MLEGEACVHDPPSSGGQVSRSEHEHHRAESRGQGCQVQEGWRGTVGPGGLVGRWGSGASSTAPSLPHW